MTDTTIRRFQIVGLVEVQGRCQYTITRKCLTPDAPVDGAGVHPECREAAWVRSQADADERVRSGYWHKGRQVDTDTTDTDDERSTTVSDGNRKPGHERGGEVRAYLLAYDGRHPFLLDMKQIVSGNTKYDRLTDRQIDAVAKFIDNEKARNTVRPETGRDLSVLPIGRTRACVENESGTLTFILIDRPEPTSKWAGWAFVKQQLGPNEDKRLGSQRPGQTYVGMWENLIDKVLADPMAAVARYGLELGECGVCGKALTNEESRATGIGPVCAARMRGEEM